MESFYTWSFDVHFDIFFKIDNFTSIVFAIL